MKQNKKNEALPDGTAVVSTRHKISSKLYDVLTESRWTTW